MKQIIITLIVIASFLSGCGNSTASIFTDFKDKPNADYVHVPKTMMKLGMAFAGKGWKHGGDGYRTTYQLGQSPGHEWL